MCLHRPSPGQPCSALGAPSGKGAPFQERERAVTDQPSQALGFYAHVLLWLHPTQKPAKRRQSRGAEEQGGPGAASSSPEAGPATLPRRLPCRGSPSFLPAQPWRAPGQCHPFSSHGNSHLRMPDTRTPPWPLPRCTLPELHQQPGQASAAAPAQNAGLDPTAPSPPLPGSCLGPAPLAVQPSDPATGRHCPAHVRGETL